MIQFQDASRKFGPTTAVAGITATVGAGEVVGLLGHNGAGKTTLMRMLTGCLQPSSGRVLVDGHDMAKDPTRGQAVIGYLPETAPLYSELLVGDYLHWMAELREVENPGRAVRLAAQKTGLMHHLGKRIEELSKGYRQRVGLAQAILHNPRLLVLDEPTNGLDPMQIGEIRSLIRELARTTTVLLSTHILAEVEAVCDRVMVVVDGKLVADAPLQELLSKSFLDLALDVAEGVRAVLMAQPFVQSVDHVEDESFARFSVRVDGEPHAHVPKLLELAAASGWVVRAITPRTTHLEEVFRELQAAEREAA